MALARAVLGISTRRTGALIRSFPSCYTLSTNRRLSDNSGQNLKVKIQDDIATVTMSKVPGNTLDLNFFEEFSSIMDDIEKSSRGMILTSSLPKIFSAGLNLMAVAQLSSVEEVDNFLAGLEKFFFRIYTSKLATVAAMNGHATAGGCAIALACDYRIMTEGSDKPYVIGLNESRLGMVLPFWLMHAFKDVLGNRNADLHAQLGTLFPTDVALKYGLIDEIATDEKLLSVANKRMKEFLSVADHSRHACKLLSRRDIVNQYRQFGDKERQKFCKLIVDPNTQNLIRQMVTKLSKGGK